MTTSARSRPIWGIASGALSILATRAGRSRRADRRGVAVVDHHAGERRRRPGGHRGGSGRRGRRGARRRGRRGGLLVAPGQGEGQPTDHEHARRRRHRRSAPACVAVPSRSPHGRHPGAPPARRRPRTTRRSPAASPTASSSPATVCSLAVAGPRRAVGQADRSGFSVGSELGQHGDAQRQRLQLADRLHASATTSPARARAARSTAGAPRQLGAVLAHGRTAPR